MTKTGITYRDFRSLWFEVLVPICCVLLFAREMLRMTLVSGFAKSLYYRAISKIE